MINFLQAFLILLDVEEQILHNTVSAILQVTVDLKLQYSDEVPSEHEGNDEDNNKEKCEDLETAKSMNVMSQQED